MTAEERAAVDWLETVDEREHMEYFTPVVGATDLFTLRRDHENVSSVSGTCYDCRYASEHGGLVVIE